MSKPKKGLGCSPISGTTPWGTTDLRLPLSKSLKLLSPLETSLDLVEVCCRFTRQVYKIDRLPSGKPLVRCIEWYIVVDSYRGSDLDTLANACSAKVAYAKKVSGSTCIFPQPRRILFHPVAYTMHAYHIRHGYKNPVRIKDDVRFNAPN